MDGITPSIAQRRTQKLRLLTGGNQLTVYKGAKFRAPENSLTGDGELHVGCQWEGHARRPFQMVIFPDGRCHCNGKFFLFDDSFLSIHGRIQFGSGYINSGAKIFIFESLVIGERVAIGESVTIRDSDNHAIEDRPVMQSGIVIEDDVWIGMNVTILKGVQIGKGSVIAAGAVVNKSIPAGVLAAGVPATIVRPIRHL